jgi:hypothetical protein
MKAPSIVEGTCGYPHRHRRLEHPKEHAAPLAAPGNRTAVTRMGMLDPAN